MAKQKTFFDKVMQRVRRDMGATGTGRYVNWTQAISGQVSDMAGAPEAERLLEAGFIPALQQEAIVRMAEECVGDARTAPYPGVMAAWAARPVTLEFPCGLVEAMRGVKPDPLGLPLSSVRALFPACLLVDVRPWKIALYESAIDALFMYPSYDMSRKYEVLCLLALNLRAGMGEAMESKMVLRGDTLGDAIDASVAERELLRGRCLAGLDKGMHDEAFSPFEDEEAVLLLAADVFGLLFCDFTEFDVEEWARGERIVPRLRPGAVPAPEEEPEPGQEDEVPEEEPEPAEEAPAEGPSPDGDAAEAPPAEGGAAGPEGEAERLAFEVELLREQLAEQESKSASLEYHLKQARAAVDEAKGAADAVRARAAIVEGLELPSTPLEALELAEAAFPDRLAFLPSARKSAEDFKKGDVAEVWAVLRSMAVVLHPLVFGPGGGNLARAFESRTGFELSLREVKMINKSERYSRMRTVAYKGGERDISPHVKGRRFKKGEALRVHFFADEGRIVIAHCGDHLETVESSSL